METTSNSFTMDFTENQTLIKNTIKEFAEKNIKPYIMQFD